jgi:SAM-dependent methyltransferase
MSGWDDSETAAYYEAFCSRHSRYARANIELIAHAQIAPGMRILDVGAGTGRTADAALRVLGESGSVICFEPSAAMRSEGMRRITDHRVRWTASLPNTAERFDRILCGAAMWMFDPLQETFLALADLLCPGGALCFNVPALYLLEPDEPGGGSDPSLLSLPEQLLATRGVALPAEADELPVRDLLTQDAIQAWLVAARLRPCSWSFRLRITQTAYADWLKIPVLTEHLFGGLPPKARAERIDEALLSTDCSSWKREMWRGWTAWKN